MDIIVSNLIYWFEELLALINGNWLLRDAFVCGFIMFVLDMFFRKDDNDK